jgi:enterochelin esterase-like enzyme
MTISLLLIAYGALAQKTLSDNYIIDTLQLKSNVFKNTRTIRVLLPPGYYEEANKSTDYPVLYLNDGVALFHAYELQKTVHALIKDKQLKPFIVVGIDNGGSTLESTNPMRDRANEYLPWPDLAEVNPDLKVEAPTGKLYPEFLLHEVMPLIKNNFRIKEGAANTGLGGSSYGSLIALYTGLKYPDIFGMLLLESPSLYVFHKQILTDAKNKTN